MGFVDCNQKSHYVVFLYSVGVIPIISLNLLLKVVLELNPESSAIDLINGSRIFLHGKFNHYCQLRQANLRVQKHLFLLHKRFYLLHNWKHFLRLLLFINSFALHFIVHYYIFQYIMVNECLIDGVKRETKQNNNDGSISQ